jgi:6-phosphofructokinase 1
MNRKNRIAILTGGGDCPGINAVIRAVVKKAILEYGMEVIGVEDGYDGLIHNRHRKLHYDDVSGILTVGGTILGASKISNPYRYAVKAGRRIVFRDVSKKTIRNARALGIDALVCIGGDGTLGIAHRLMRDGIPVVGIPKTIDNDLRGTDVTFGFDTAVAIATEAIDRLHTTAQSHHRIMIVELMGHRAGWIALFAGVAGGGDIILIPEIPYDIKAVAAKVRERNRIGRRFSIVVVAEGAKPKGGDIVVKRMVEKSADPVRLGGVGFVLRDRSADRGPRASSAGRVPDGYRSRPGDTAGLEGGRIDRPPGVRSDGRSQGRHRHFGFSGGRSGRIQDRPVGPSPDRRGTVDRDELRRPIGVRSQHSTIRSDYE